MSPFNKTTNPSATTTMGKCATLALLLLCSILFLSSASVSADPSIWPQPKQQQISSTHKVSIYPDPTISPQSILEQVPIFKNAVDRYLKIMFGNDAIRARKGIFATDSATEEMVSQWNVKIDNPNTKLSMDSDESYTLKITENAVELSSKEVWGALRALESLSQLVEKKVLQRNGQPQAQNTNSLSQFAVYEAPVADIQDAPRYKWRGLLLDVSRHFLSPRTIKRMIDALAYNKMNVLHIHLTDAQSFPLEVKDFPDLSNRALWHEGMQYTREILSDIVQYAYARGVRVIPEVDIPGHAYSWGIAYPDAVAQCPKLMERTHNINNIPLNMGKEIVYDLLKGILDELSSSFVDDFVHLGGDEVVKSCWREDDSITQFMRDNNLKTYDDFEGYFESRLEQLYRRKNRRMVSWQELADIEASNWKLPNDSIIQVWKEAQDLPAYTASGHKLLLSGGWYLDKSVPDSQQTPPYLFGDNWKNMYLVEPEKYLTESQSELLLGGEAAQWAEQVDENTIDARIWPRAAAVAERLWSPKNVNDTKAAEPRLIRHRCQVLVKRGIKAFPLRPDYCPYVWGDTDL